MDTDMDMGTDMQRMLRGSKNKRRFSDEQIKTLEYMFESEARPESRTKQQLANDIGLQPRQVAIWFQNRRARSKTKQIEHEYSRLKASFDSLVSSYESMKRENQSLLVQIEKLKKMLEEHEHGSKEVEINTGDNSEGKSTNGNFDGLVSDFDQKMDISEDIDVMKKELTESSGDWCKFEPSYVPEESSSGSQWWDFWS